MRTELIVETKGNQNHWQKYFSQQENPPKKCVRKCHKNEEVVLGGHLHDVGVVLGVLYHELYSL